MYKLLRNDFYRNSHSFWNIFFIAIFIGLQIFYLANGNGSNLIEIDPYELDKELAQNATLMDYVVMLSFTNIFTVFFISICISRDIGSEILNNLVLSGISRTELFLGRIISCLFAYLGLLSISCISMVFIYKALNIRYLINKNQMLKILILTIAAAVLFTIIENLVIFVFRNLIASVAISIAGYIIVALCPYYYHVTFDMSASELINKFYRPSLLAFCIMIIVASVLGVLLFRKKDIR